MPDKVTAAAAAAPAGVPEGTPQALLDTLNYLVLLMRERLRPEQARAKFQPLRARHPAMSMQLVWEEETFDRSVHYDVLIGLPDSATISLSYCNDGAMPWPLRGVHRWSDADLVRVNNTVLSVDQAIACLDFIWDEARITDRLLNICVIEEELARAPVPVSDQQLQEGMDNFRRARKLFRADDTFDWMQRRGISHQELEKLVESQLMIAGLRDRVVHDHVSEYFEAHRADFDAVQFARLTLRDEALARETFEQIDSKQLNFFEAAQRCFQSGQATGSEFFINRQRREIAADLRPPLFDAPLGGVIGPLQEETGFSIVSILSRTPATLDSATAAAIQQILFDAWLERRRQASAIEWYWGNASQNKCSVSTVEILRERAGA